MKSEQIKEIMEKATEQLVAALNAGHSEALTGYLKAIGRFHRYSLHNVILIASQKPNASYVAGFRTWNGLGRFVKKGEKGILILAPIVRRMAESPEDQEESSTSIAGFRAAYVFDVSQTGGKELPQAFFLILAIGTTRSSSSKQPDCLARSRLTRRVVTLPWLKNCRSEGSRIDQSALCR
jgi:antirestriction protein ArdC